MIWIIGYKADNANCLHSAVHHPDYGDSHPYAFSSVIKQLQAVQALQEEAEAAAERDFARNSIAMWGRGQYNPAVTVSNTNLRFYNSLFQINNLIV